MIFCVWYPSGGFGHFVNSILNLYGQGFARPKKQLEFSPDGNSHALDYVAPAYQHDQTEYHFDFDPRFNYSVIVDNGINNESTKFLEHFPKAKIVKLCLSDRSWPIVCHTMIHKAMRSNFGSELAVDLDRWDTQDAWAQREKYFLFLRDHPIRQRWRPSSFSVNLLIEDLWSYDLLIRKLESTGITLEDFSQIHTEWRTANQLYFDPILTAERFLDGQVDRPVLDIWTQAVIYYQIWCRYGIEVPHNDFADFFESPRHMQSWLETVR